MNEIIFHWLNNWAGQWTGVDWLIIFIANYLGWFLGFGLIAYAIWCWGQPLAKVQLGFILAATVAAAVISEIGKWLYFSPRPFLVLDNVHLLFTHGANDSFPSGHALILMALATSLYLFNKKLGNLYLVGAVLVSAARVMAGIHWPSDILGGWALAWLIVLGFYYLFHPMVRRTEHFRAF